MTQARAEIAFIHSSVCFLVWFPQTYFNALSSYSFILLLVGSFISDCCSCAASKRRMWENYTQQNSFSVREMTKTTYRNIYAFIYGCSAFLSYLLSCYLQARGMANL